MNHRRALGLALLTGLLLRLHPILVPYVEPDLQDAYPRAALLAVVDGHWRPPWLGHGPGFFDLLRGLYSAWYAVGALFGIYPTSESLLAAFVLDPLPFLVAARLVVVVCAIVTLRLAATLAIRLFGEGAGAIAALLLAVAFVHVRESHQVWPDVPAAAATLAAVVAALRAADARRLGAVVLAGALAGLAVATKHSAAPVLAPVALAAWAAGGSVLERSSRLLAVAVAAAVAYGAASPYAVLAFEEARSFVAMQAKVSFSASVNGLPWRLLIELALGWPVTALAIVGLLSTARRVPATVIAIAAAFPVLYGGTLMVASRVFLRYLALAAPFAAVFAAGGIVAIGRVVFPRRAGFAAGVLAIAVALPSLVADVRYDRFLALEDTRHLAGAWIAANAKPGMPIVLPDAIDYPSPVLPETCAFPRALAHYRTVLRELLPSIPPPPRALMSNGQLLGIPSTPGIIVTAEHPAVMSGLNPTPETIALLRANGAFAYQRFTGLPPLLPPNVIYDPLDGDYVPLRGWESLVRPGPTLTMWRVLVRRSRQRAPG